MTFLRGTRRLNPFRWDRSTGRLARYGLGLLVATKLGDVLTTLAGLRLPNARESNPVAAAAIHTFGVFPGLLALSVSTVAVVALVTELGVFSISLRDDADVWMVAAVRVVGYVFPSLVYVCVDVHNLFVLVGLGNGHV